MSEENNAAGSEYKVTVTGEGLDFSRSVSQDVALQIMTSALGAAPLTLPPPGPRAADHSSKRPPTEATGSGPNGGTPQLTVGEYLRGVGAKRNPDKIAAIAAYLKQHREIERFSKEDIKSEFPNAGESVPANFPRDFSWTVNAKWIAVDSSGGKNQHYITSTGLKAVDHSFSADVQKASRHSAGRRRSARKKADVSK